MTFIHKQLTLEIDESSEAMFSKDRSQYGYIPNYSKLIDSLGASPDSIFETCDNEFKKLFVIGRPISEEIDKD